MMTLDEMQNTLDELAEQLPAGLFEELNGGIILLPDAKLCPEARNGDLYTLGEYRSGGVLGSYIVFYYGSFRHLFGDRPDSYLRKELDKTLKHEFTHHLEYLTGAHALDDEDDAYLANYLYGQPGYRTPKLGKHRYTPYSCSDDEL